jgi:hypothetical protein
MSVLLFSLRGVPSDEAGDVRELLSTHGIAYYETSAGAWGISQPAIWLNHAADLQAARQLLDEYQFQRSLKQRALYEERKRLGQQPGFVQHNLKHPFRFLSYCAISALLIYLSLHWAFNLVG